MPRPIIAPLLALFAAASTAQHRTGMPGDDLSLAGILEIFKRNIEMQRFEEELNADSTGVNRLDLDANGVVDLLCVESRPREDDVVTIAIRALVNNEQQDVAVILVGRTGEVGALVQIHGDEDLYPANTFIEPGTQEPGSSVDQPPMNVWEWRPVPWCFSLRYYTYVPTWSQEQRPPWWTPVVATADPTGQPPLAGYRSWPTCRLPKAWAAYAPFRRRAALKDQAPGDTSPAKD